MSEDQEQVASWIKETLGEDAASNGQERVLRLVEEAIELAQALDINVETLIRLILYVYAREPGKPAQEIAGCMVTLYGAASALSVDAHEVFAAELQRIHTPEVMERVRRRQAEKRIATKT